MKIFQIDNLDWLSAYNKTTIQIRNYVTHILA